MVGHPRREAYVVTWLSWIRANGDGARRHEWSTKLCYKLKMHRGIDGMFVFSNWRVSTFQFNGRFYPQVDGVAMGSPIAPLMADVCMNYVIDQALVVTPPEFDQTCFAAT